MGRLTLNMLLSFAQFEREVTAERIRDKLAASKARGMWMGGTPPLGYEPNGRNLAIVEEHADLVRWIFQLYLDLGTVRGVCDELDRRGIVKPLRISKAGKSYGGRPFGRGELYALLSNPIYIGRIQHKGVLHQGLHPTDHRNAGLGRRPATAQGPSQRRAPYPIRRPSQPARPASWSMRMDSRLSLPMPARAPSAIATMSAVISSWVPRMPSRPAHPGARDRETDLRPPGVLFDDPVALMEQINPGYPLPDSITSTIAICRNTAGILRGADHPRHRTA